MWFPSGVEVGAVWLLKEVGALFLKDTAARMGRIGYVYESAELSDKVVDSDGRVWETQYVTTQGGGERHLRFVANGHLFNETDTPLLLREPRVVFWGEDGLRVRHVNPDLIVAGTSSSVVTVPAHGTVPIRMELGMMNSDLGGMYADAIPVLELETTRGKGYQFALKTSAMWRIGESFVAWDTRRNKVVRAGTREFARARRKGSLGPIRGR
jgi:hypothetical protein